MRPPRKGNHADGDGLHAPEAHTEAACWCASRGSAGVHSRARYAWREASGTIDAVIDTGYTGGLTLDPVRTGFVGSLARPGGNITGLTVQGTDIQGKALQLLKDAVPTAP